MTTPAEILAAHGIRFESNPRYYTTCPQCSAKRGTREHQQARVLGITIDDDRVSWGCNHCGWTGGGRYDNSKDNGHAKGHHHNLFVAIYPYRDEQGTLLFEVCRTADKQFPQRKPNGHGGWTWKTQGVRKVLYQLPELMEDIAAEHVILTVEGEKDVNALRAIGVPATCNPGGASEPGKKPKWRAEYSETLRGADIVIVPDNDANGHAHADAVARMSLGIASRIRLLDLATHWPGMPKGSDISDWLVLGHTREELDTLIDNAPDWSPAADAHDTEARDDPRAPEYSDEALALLFAQHHQQDLRYVAFRARWLLWRGWHWILDDTLNAFDRARAICRQQAATCGEPKTASMIASAKTVSAVERLATADRRLAASADQWNSDPEAFNTPRT